MNWLISLIVGLVRVLLPWAVKKSRPTAEDAAPDQQTRDTLREKVRSHWLFAAAAMLVVAASLPGCGSGAPFTRTIYVPHGTPVRLRETIKNAKVWVKDADGKVVAGQMDVPEGWYALPVDEAE